MFLLFIGVATATAVPLVASAGRKLIHCPCRNNEDSSPTPSKLYPRLYRDNARDCYRPLQNIAEFRGGRWRPDALRLQRDARRFSSRHEPDLIHSQCSSDLSPVDG